MKKILYILGLFTILCPIIKAQETNIIGPLPPAGTLSLKVDEVVKQNYMDKTSSSLEALANVKDEMLRDDGIKPYVDSYKEMMDEKSPMNKGVEPFKQFILKFMTDREFRDERVVLSAEELAVYKSTDHSYLFSVDVHNIDDGVPFSGWLEMSQDEAKFMNGYVFGEAIDLTTFNRSGDEWYLTEYLTFSYDDEEENEFE